jgi:UDP-glucuronate 4-epimerase
MILLTGVAGFIGYHVAERLLGRGESVLGVDNLNDYYDVALKEARLNRLQRHAAFRFVWADLADRAAVQDLFDGMALDRVVHLAAQAGVRYSLTNPHAYINSNVTGFLNILEGCRHAHVRHLVYASSSSVYGANTRLPFSVQDNVDHPVSLYAATKKANELMAHSYAHLFGLPCTGLRFFTVYGPWGRPDMALFVFTRAILEGRPVRLFNEGRMSRDFTYIDDVVSGVLRVLDLVPRPDPEWDGRASDPGRSAAPWRVYNLGNHQSVPLPYLVQLLEKELGRKAAKEPWPMQAGDVRDTCADVSDLRSSVGFQPETPIEVGVARYVDWFRDYYGVD